MWPNEFFQKIYSRLHSKVLFIRLSKCHCHKILARVWFGVFIDKKQFWLFWGLVPIGRQNVDTPADGTFEMEEKFKLGDFLISGLTGGIVSSRTIKCLDKK